jgi:Uma2 family endonuclease
MSATLAPALSARERWAALPEGTRAELFNLELIMSPSPSRDHAFIVREIGWHLGNWLRAAKSKGDYYLAPFDVFLTDSIVLQPDVLYVSGEHLDRLGDNGVRGAPDWVVEVLSPSNTHHDLVVKKNLYEAHGVSEYWIIDPETHTVEVLYLTENGQYQIHQRAQSGRVESRNLHGFGVNLEELFQL